MAINLERYVTISEGSALTGRSVDTIERRMKNELLPSARKRAGDAKGTWELQLADLVAIGLLDPSSLPEEASLEDLVPRSRAERDLQKMTHELAIAKIKLAAVEKELARADGQSTQWRRMAEALSKTVGAR